MGNYDSIIFDLDGTLWNASEASAKGWSKAAKLHGINNFHVSVEDIKKVSGKPFADCLKTIFPNVDISDCADLICSLQEQEKSSIEVHGGKIYEGVLDGVVTLSKSYKLFLVSNCQDWYLNSFWNFSSLKYYFNNWDCHGISGQQKSEMIKAIVARNKLLKPIYIGDTEGDKQASQTAEVDFGHASYGFGSVSESSMRFRSFNEIVYRFKA